MAKNLAQIIADARALSNTQRSKFVTDDEIGNYVNRAVRSLYDYIIAADESYYSNTLDLTFGSGSEAAATMPLPPDFYKVRNLVINPDTLNARPIYSKPMTNHIWDGVGYYMSSNTISIGPAQQAAGGGGPYRLYYVPKPPQFGPAINVQYAPTSDAVVASTGVWTFVNGAFPAAYVGASLLVAGAANAGNNGTFAITAVTPTTITTSNVGLVNESFGSGVSASIVLQAITPTYPVVTPYQAASMVTLDTTLDNFDDFLSCWTAIRIVEKKKQDTSTLVALLEDISGRVQAMAPDRSGEPEAAPVLWSPSLYPYRGIFPGLPGSGFGN